MTLRSIVFLVLLLLVFSPGLSSGRTAKECREELEELTRAAAANSSDLTLLSEVVSCQLLTRDYAQAIATGRLVLMRDAENGVQRLADAYHEATHTELRRDEHHVATWLTADVDVPHADLIEALAEAVFEAYFDVLAEQEEPLSEQDLALWTQQADRLGGRFPRLHDSADQLHSELARASGDVFAPIRHLCSPDRTAADRQEVKAFLLEHWPAETAEFQLYSACIEAQSDADAATIIEIFNARATGEIAFLVDVPESRLAILGQAAVLLNHDSFDRQLLGPPLAWAIARASDGELDHFHSILDAAVLWRLHAADEASIDRASILLLGLLGVATWETVADHERATDLLETVASEHDDNLGRLAAAALKQPRGGHYRPAVLQTPADEANLTCTVGDDRPITPQEQQFRIVGVSVDQNGGHSIDIEVTNLYERGNYFQFGTTSPTTPRLIDDQGQQARYRSRPKGDNIHPPDGQGRPYVLKIAEGETTQVTLTFQPAKSTGRHYTLSFPGMVNQDPYNEVLSYVLHDNQLAGVRTRSNLQLPDGKGGIGFELDEEDVLTRFPGATIANNKLEVPFEPVANASLLLGMRDGRLVSIGYRATGEQDVERLGAWIDEELRSVWGEPVRREAGLDGPCSFSRYGYDLASNHDLLLIQADCADDVGPTVSHEFQLLPEQL